MTIEKLQWAVAEGVIFNLAHYVEILQEASGVPAQSVVLSGNGFMESSLAALLAALIPAEVRMPEFFGTAALLGDAVVGFQALGEDASEALASMFDRAPVVAPLNDPYLKDRF